MKYHTGILSQRDSPMGLGKISFNCVLRLIWGKVGKSPAIQAPTSPAIKRFLLVAPVFVKFVNPKYPYRMSEVARNTVIPLVTPIRSVAPGIGCKFRCRCIQGSILTSNARPKQPACMSKPKHFVGLDIGGSTIKAVTASSLSDLERASNFTALQLDSAHGRSFRFRGS